VLQQNEKGESSEFQRLEQEPEWHSRRLYPVSHIYMSWII
jgi:hypothetical protein